MYTLESFFAEAKAELFRSNKDRRHPFRTLVLATQGPFPGLRTIVKRKITSELNILAYTDSRSPKTNELASHSACSLLFYHPKKKLQIIVQATANCITSGTEYEEHQNNAVRYSKDYFTVQPPGTPIPSTEYTLGEEAFFTLLSFTPARIQVLQLSDPQHYRAEFSRSNDWSGQWLVP